MNPVGRADSLAWDGADTPSLPRLGPRAGSAGTRCRPTPVRHNSATPRGERSQARVTSLRPRGDRRAGPSDPDVPPKAAATKGPGHNTWAPNSSSGSAGPAQVKQLAAECAGDAGQRAGTRNLGNTAAELGNRSRSGVRHAVIVSHCRTRRGILLARSTNRPSKWKQT
jgi:hypothetical protein